MLLQQDDYDDDRETKIKTTRFAEGTNLNGNNGSKKPTLTRDHSLGREILCEGEAVTLDGFSWQDPFKNGTRQSQKTSPTNRVPSNGPPPPPAPYPHEYRYPSHGSVPPPMPYGGPGPNGSDRYPSGRFESWGSNFSMQPPPPVPAYGYPPHHSGSWSQRDGSWSHREHSFSRNPLPHASVRHPAPSAYFDTRTGSWGPPRPDGYTGPWGPHPPAQDGRVGSWGAPPNGRMGSWGPPPPPGTPDGRMGSWGPVPSDGRMGSWGPPSVMPPYGPPGYYHSGGPPPPPHYGPPQPSAGRTSSSPVQSPSPKPSSKAPPSPSYAVDPKVASKWSGQDEAEIKKSWSAESSTSEEVERFDPMRHRPNGRIIVDVRPDLIKRGTSHQNETTETKPDLRGPSVKRAALNRDSSAAANRLKEQYVPGFKKSSFNAEQEVKALSENLEQSWPGVRPESMAEAKRQSTIDVITMDLIAKPVAFTDTSRSNTLDALNVNIELDDDPMPSSSKPATVARSRTMEEVFNEMRDGVIEGDFVPRPSTISGSDRMTTNDILAIIAEPLNDEGLDDDGGDDGMTFEKPLTLSRETSLTENWVTEVG